MNRITVYGIANCDTIKKALGWFKKNKIPVYFYDYKKTEITKDKLTEWCKQKGWENILNKKSTTWRALASIEQEKIITTAAAIKLMMQNNSIIKRPVVETNNAILTGFNEEEYKRAFK